MSILYGLRGRKNGEGEVVDHTEQRMSFFGMRYEGRGGKCVINSVGL